MLLLALILILGAIAANSNTAGVGGKVGAFVIFAALLVVGVIVAVLDYQTRRKP